MSTPLEIPDGILERVRGLCLALPEVTVRTDLPRVETRSTAYSFDIRRRSFCLLVVVAEAGREPAPLLVVRAAHEERAAVLDAGRRFFTPRGGRDRLGVWLVGDPDWTEIRELVTDSYRRIAPQRLSALLG